jgi:hypothetical protein
LSFLWGARRRATGDHWRPKQAPVGVFSVTVLGD